MSKVKRPSTKASYGDGSNAENMAYAQIPGLYSIWSINNSFNAVASGTGASATFFRKDLLTGRHSKTSNFLFLDGHVENLTAGYLANRWLADSKKMPKKQNMFELTE